MVYSRWSNLLTGFICVGWGSLSDLRGSLSSRWGWNWFMNQQDSSLLRRPLLECLWQSVCPRFDPRQGLMTRLSEFCLYFRHRESEEKTDLSYVRCFRLFQAETFIISGIWSRKLKWTSLRMYNIHKWINSCTLFRLGSDRVPGIRHLTKSKRP